ncbi:hypothetical protein [Adlercreutzia sp. ZJ154]|uniref:hypothetical protein n=1 Tax=Adlercreutzia sp. ZJ154 TaxID=2709790 RepID=UPI0013EA15C0|nr:hypothetical protein [Adlercreutzia sp. ZJ154]
MADVQEYAARLAQAIGPRPAGTEEEQQASFVIEDVLQKEASLNVQSEEFNCNPNFELPRIICCIITLVLAILTLFLPVMVLPSLIVCAITAVLYVLEVMGISPLSRMSKRGVSQNVIGKYIPMQTGEQVSTARRRKVVLIARYDSGKVARELSSLCGILNIIHWVELAAMVIVPVALLLRMITKAEGGLLIFIDVLVVIGIIGALLPVVSFLLRQTAPYNDGANCNAAGVAVMLEVAKRIGLGLYDKDEEVEIHGETAAREAGLLPANAEVDYAAMSPDGMSPSNTNAMPPMDLSAEIEAVQAVRSQSQSTEQPAEVVSAVPQGSPQIASPGAIDMQPDQAAPVQPTSAQPIQPASAQSMQFAATQVVPASPVAASVSNSSNTDVPDWYKRAREKANKSATDSVPVQRSRFAEAMEAATAAREAEAARAAEQQKGQVSEVEKRLAAMRASIMGETAAQHSNSHAPSGVDGFLASTTDAPNYETASASASLDDLANAENSNISETKQTGNVADRIISHSPTTAAQPIAEEKPDAAVKPSATTQSESASVSQSATAQRQPAVSEPAPNAAAKQEPRPRRSISLPSLTGAIQAVNQKQSAAADNDDQIQNEPVLPDVQARRERQSALSASIPSLDAPSSAENTRVKVSAYDDLDEQNGAINVSQAGSFTVGGATGAFEPVGNELLANVDPDDVYIDDADDSDYGDSFTESGAMAGPGYVDMPSSRKSRVFGKFRRHKKREEESFTEALGIDEDFDARKVGKKRGGWESFQNESAGFNGAWDEEDDWDGGAFSKERLGEALSRIKPGSSDGEDHSRTRRSADDLETPRTRFAGTEMVDDYEEMADSSRVLNPFADIPLKGLAEEREAVQEFHNGPINMEIWFVALGAELADNAGIKALIDAHGAELKGAMIVDLDGLGAGNLSLIEREGMFRPVKMSSRMKRYVRKASAALGLSVGKGNMLWRNSAACVAAQNGYQALHLAGLDGNKPAYFGQADDVIDNISEDIMLENADFVMEFIRAI